jgi:hypothetical protein
VPGSGSFITLSNAFSRADRVHQPPILRLPQWPHRLRPHVSFAVVDVGLHLQSPPSVALWRIVRWGWFARWLRILSVSKVFSVRKEKVRGESVVRKAMECINRGIGAGVGVPQASEVESYEGIEIQMSTHGTVLTLDSR